MKLHYYLVLLALVTFSIAAPNRLRRSDTELPSTANWQKKNVVVVPKDSHVSRKHVELDRLDKPEDLTVSTATGHQADPADSSSYTNRTLSAREDKYYAELWMSNERVNVGTLRGPRLYWKLFNCFNTLCKHSNGDWECNDDVRTDFCTIENVVSTKNGETYDASSTLTISYALVKGGHGKDLTTPTHDMLATMFSVMPEQEHNCRWVNFADSRRTKICNIAHRALVAFPMRDGGSEPQTVFIATIETNAPDAGDFYCDGPLRKRVYDFFHNKAKGDFMKAEKDSLKGYIEAHVKCQDDSQCWLHDKWRNCYDKGRW